MPKKIPALEFMATVQDYLKRGAAVGRNCAAAIAIS